MENKISKIDLTKSSDEADPYLKEKGSTSIRVTVKPGSFKKTLSVDELTQPNR